jgi:uncharacterized BrkB/YihY/UPF0761 family membrane protein
LFLVVVVALLYQFAPNVDQLYLYISFLTILFGAELNATLAKMKEEISGKQVIDAKPADNC